MANDKHNVDVIINNYLGKMAYGSFSYYFKDNLPEKKINNAIKKFASGLEKSKIVGFYDTTVLGNGKGGYIFTDTKLYYSVLLEKSKKIWYDDIKFVEVIKSGKKDSDNKLLISFYDDSTIILSDSFINKTPLCYFLREIIKLEQNFKYEKYNIEYNEYDNSGAISGGIHSSNYKQVNKLYEEETFSARQGHGFAAERANNIYDKLSGHDAKIIGDDNIKNGADRLVDGVAIQSKYCQTGRACINECFDNEGNFRYTIDGKPMQIEVPSDKFDSAVTALEEKIREGKVPGVVDPNEAKNIVRKGHFTYEQAKNIAKAGTIESLTYDSVHGIIISSSAFGVTAIITFATNIWDGEDFENSLKLAGYAGLKVGGTAFVTTVMSSQLSKSGLNKMLIGSSEAIVKYMGPKASSVLINAFRGSKPIYGAAAMKSAAKLLRSNVITSGITIVVLSSADIVNIFRGRISGKQLFKNLTNTTSTTVGGVGGALVGASVGSSIPIIGTVIGGIAGSIIGGVASGKATDAIFSNFIEEDADKMLEIIQDEFEVLAQNYLLNQKEAEKVVDKLSEKLNGSLLKDMFASEDKTKFIKNILIPIIDNEIKKREHIGIISDERMAESLIEVLEDISDSLEDSENI